MAADTATTGPTTTPETRQPGYWDLMGARVRHVVATSPHAAQALTDIGRAQAQPAVALEVATTGHIELQAAG